MRDLAVGIDIGTTGIKAVVIDNFGGILFEASESHDLLSPHPGFAEEDASIWWDNVLLLLKKISNSVDTERICGIALSGMVPTLIPVDDHGHALYNSIQQNDARAVREIEEYKARIEADAYFSRTGNSVNQQIIYPKWTWLTRHAPEIVSKTSFICGSYDYCTYRLTGVPVIERNWALESGMWLIEEETWDEEILRIASIDREKLPKVCSSGDVIGPITPEVAHITGIPNGTPVVVGIADHVASALATGVRDSGDLLLKLGGAGDILFATDTLRMDPRLFIDYHPLENRYLINGCMAASGSIVKWITNLFQDTDFNRLTEEASQLPPGSKDLILLPYFLGEKTPIFDTNARGVFFGLNFGHDRAALFRSVLEAVAYGFYHHVEILQEMGCDVEHVYLSNGGARSPLWKQIVLDVIGKDGTYVPNHPGSCIGAAFIVQKSIGPTKDWQALERFLSRGERIAFSPENHNKYSHYYKTYRDLYESVKYLFPRLSQEEYS